MHVLQEAIVEDGPAGDHRPEVTCRSSAVRHMRSRPFWLQNPRGPKPEVSDARVLDAHESDSNRAAGNRGSRTGPGARRGQNGVVYPSRRAGAWIQDGLGPATAPLRG